MKKEFNLSELGFVPLEDELGDPVYHEEDVKEFIRILKQEMDREYDEGNYINQIIDKLAGDRLNGK